MPRQKSRYSGSDAIARTRSRSSIPKFPVTRFGLSQGRGASTGGHRELPGTGAARARRPPGLLQRAASLASVALIAVSCDSAPPPDAVVVPLTPSTASPAPFSRDEVALATERTACVIDTYESRIHCIHRDGERTHVFGWRGQGPGEFSYSPRYITGGPDGTVAVIGMTTMAIFEPSGTLVTEVRLPPVDSALTGEPYDWPTPGQILPVPRHVAIDVRTGEILWERVYPGSMAAEAECPPLVSPSGLPIPDELGFASRFPSGGVVFSLCRGQMLFLAHPDDDDGIVVRAPLYNARIPNPEGCGAIPGSLRVSGLAGHEYPVRAGTVPRQRHRDGRRELVARRHVEAFAPAEPLRQDQPLLVDGQPLDVDPLDPGHVDHVRVAGVLDADRLARRRQEPDGDVEGPAGRPL